MNPLTILLRNMRRTQVERAEKITGLKPDDKWTEEDIAKIDAKADELWKILNWDAHSATKSNP